MKKVNGFEIIQLFEQFSPKAYAMDGDKVGLQIGTLNKKIERVMVALDILDEVVDEAIEKDVQLIIAHHPPIYRPLDKLTTDSKAGKMIEKIIKHDIAIYAAHTNLDVAKGGVNDLLAEALGLENTEVLVPTYHPQLMKLVVYVPLENAKEVREALGKAGAGEIGEYSHCSFSVEGEGRFLPGRNANPYLGKQGRLETVREVKIETIVQETMLKKAVNAMIKAHPYEEVAYDIFPLENKGEALGLGRIGKIPEMSLREFAEVVKETLHVKTVRIIGDENAIVKKAAVLGGDGNKYYKHALFKGADVYITGDIYYHTAHDALMEGLNIIDPGHNVEKIMKSGVAKKLGDLCNENGYEVSIIESKIDSNPFKTV